jgi:hypothetical protein
MKDVQRTIGIILLVVAVLVFVLGAARIGLLISRATVGLWEAAIIAGLALVLLLTSRVRR